MNEVIPLRVQNLTIRNRDEKPGVNREFGLCNITFELKYGYLILLIGPRGAGKGALIDCIDREAKGVIIAKSIDKLRINQVDELKCKCLGRDTLILSEGHKYEKQKSMVLIAKENNCILLASMDRDQVTDRRILDSFTHIMLLNEGTLVTFIEPNAFLQRLPELIKNVPNLKNDFPELQNLL